MLVMSKVNRSAWDTKLTRPYEGYLTAPCSAETSTVAADRATIMSEQQLQVGSIATRRLPSVPSTGTRALGLVVQRGRLSPCDPASSRTPGPI